MAFGMVSRGLALAFLLPATACSTRPVESARPPDDQLFAVETHPANHFIPSGWTIWIVNRPVWGDPSNRFTAWLSRTTREISIRAAYFDEGVRKQARAYEYWSPLALIPHTWPLFLVAGLGITSQVRECEAVFSLPEPVAARYLVTLDWVGPDTTARASLVTQGADAEVVARVPCSADGMPMPRDPPVAFSGGAPAEEPVTSRSNR